MSHFGSVPEKINWEQYREFSEASVARLERLSDVARRLGIGGPLNALAAEIDRLRTNRFAVAVMGDFKTGKSTLINGLLGRDVLPTDLLPCTAALCRITYAEKPYARVHFRDGCEQDIPLDDLVAFTTKLSDESAQAASLVREVEVGYPIELCRNGVVLLDTPGLDDEAGLTDITISVLPQVDAVLFVMIPEKPVSEREREFFAEKLLIHQVHRVLFVVNGIDRVAETTERQRILDVVEHRLRKPLLARLESLAGEPDATLAPQFASLSSSEVLAVSARNALRAKREISGTLPMDLGFAALEQQLQHLVLSERGALLLARAERLQRRVAPEIDAVIDERLAELDSRRKRLVQEVNAVYGCVQEIKVASDGHAQRISDAATAANRIYSENVNSLLEQAQRVGAKSIDEAIIPALEFVAERDKLVKRLADSFSESILAILEEGANLIRKNFDTIYLQAVQQAEGHIAETEALMHRCALFRVGMEAGSDLACRRRIPPNEAPSTVIVSFDKIESGLAMIAQRALTYLVGEESSTSHSLAKWTSNFLFKAPTDNLFAVNIYRFREFVKKEVRNTINVSLNESEVDQLRILRESLVGRFEWLAKRFAYWQKAVEEALCSYTVQIIFDQAEDAAREKIELERLRAESRR
jgi:hypothetical protein